MKFSYAVFLIIAAIVIESCLQRAPEIEWQKTFGGTHQDYASDVQQVKDGGYIISGTTHSYDGDVIFNHGFSDFWALKMDRDGKLLWQKTYGGSYFDENPFIQPTTDGGYVMAGLTYNFDGDVSGFHGWGDWWIVKVDALGNIQWQWALGGKLYEAPSCIIQTSDGTYIAAGNTYSTDGDVTGNHGEVDVWIVRLDQDGNIKWQRCYGGSKYDAARFIQQTADGGYIIASDTNSPDGNLKTSFPINNTCIFKIDSSGIIQWKTGFAVRSWTSIVMIRQTTDLGYILVGSAAAKIDSGSTVDLKDLWIAKLDSTGKTDWQQFYGGLLDDMPTSVIQADDGNFLITGVTNSIEGGIRNNHGLNDGFLIKVNPKGKIIWEKTFGGSSDDAINSIYQTSDGGYILSGLTKSSDGDLVSNMGKEDLWIIKLKPDR